MERSVLLFLSAFTGLCSFAQNTCSTALPIAPGGTYTVLAVDGTQATPANCTGSGGDATHAEWYVFTATVDTTIRISTDYPGASTDTRIQVYTGGCGALTCYDGDDDSGAIYNYASIATFYVYAGTIYHVAFDDYWTDAGFQFTVSEYDAPPPPPDLISFTALDVPVDGNVLACLDMNGDHRDDIVGTSATNVNIFHQLSGGTFQSVNIVTEEAENVASWSIAAGDIDGNHHNDLLYGGGQGATFMMATDDGTGFVKVNFEEYIFCQRTNMVDINNDGHLDAFSCHDVDANVSFLNDGSGNLTFGQGMLGTTCGNYGSIWTDYDNDGDMDMFVAKCGCDPVDILMRNNGDGTFTDVAAELGFADGHQSWSSAWGDYDNDEDMDVLVGSSASGYHKLMRNNGDGTFTDITAGSGIDLFTGESNEWTTHDFDNNGYLDIFGGGGMLMNQGDLTFLVDETIPYNGPIGDLDDDGYLDVLNASTIHFNNSTGNNWLKVALEGTWSNTNGIGARITVMSASGPHIREVRSGDGFRYMSSLNAHFGLGTDPAVLQVEVRWPSGTVDVIADVDINSTLVVVEGQFNGVAEHAAPALTIFPVPATDRLTVSGAHAPNSAVRVFDTTGKLVLQGQLAANTLDVAVLNCGFYVLEVATAKGSVRQAFSKF
ncbi:MAG TPA: FG-GAP-like repeat-containing protein [Flavobacteriales bacterium]|nr:FG-GAP-like repeat-containing protein [Flavobacteriales bacterium]